MTDLGWGGDRDEMSTQITAYIKTVVLVSLLVVFSSYSWGISHKVIMNISHTGLRSTSPSTHRCKLPGKQCGHMHWEP